MQVKLKWRERNSGLESKTENQGPRQAFQWAASNGGFNQSISTILSTIMHFLHIIVTHISR